MAVGGIKRGIWIWERNDGQFLEIARRGTGPKEVANRFSLV